MNMLPVLLCATAFSLNAASDLDNDRENTIATIVAKLESELSPLLDTASEFPPRIDAVPELSEDDRSRRDRIQPALQELLDELRKEFQGSEELLGIAAIRFYAYKSNLDWFWKNPWIMPWMVFSFDSLGVSRDQLVSLLANEDYSNSMARVIAQVIYRTILSDPFNKTTDDDNLYLLLKRLDELGTLYSHAAAFLIQPFFRSSRFRDQVTRALIERTGTLQEVKDEFELETLDGLGGIPLEQRRCSKNTWVRLSILLAANFPSDTYVIMPCQLEREDMHPLEKYWLEMTQETKEDRELRRKVNMLPPVLGFMF